MNDGEGSIEYPRSPGLSAQTSPRLEGEIAQSWIADDGIPSGVFLREDDNVF